MAWRGSTYRPASQERPSPYPAQARARFHQPKDGHQQKEPEMARGRKAREPQDDGGEVKQKDFDRVERLYRGDIKPAKSEAASQLQAVGEAYKVVRKECHVRPDAVRGAIKAFEMEEVHRDDYLESFVGTFNKLMGREVLTFRRDDLFSSLATTDEDDGFLEASEEELAAQRPRADAAAKRASQAELAATAH